MSKVKEIVATIFAVVALVVTSFTGALLLNTTPASQDAIVSFVDGEITYDIPEYNNKPYITLNNNEPIFEEFDLKTEAYEEYSDLDNLGRCTLSSAIVCKETMPKQGEKRGSISNVKPTGWVQAKYDCVPGKMLYNRCHLIGWQLTAENANKKNLITGTRYMNIDGMIDHENMVAEYVKENNGYVAYQVTPIFNDTDLVAIGVQMEGYSIDDNGQAICFNIFAYNVQPGIDIDYKTGNSKLIEQIESNSALLFVNWKIFQKMLDKLIII
jgi:DNA-entry nuclease